MYLANGIIQTVVLSLWMEWGPIFPSTIADPSVADGALAKSARNTSREHCGDDQHRASDQPGG